MICAAARRGMGQKFRLRLTQRGGREKLDEGVHGKFFWSR